METEKWGKRPGTLFQFESGALSVVCGFYNIGREQVPSNFTLSIVHGSEWLQFPQFKKLYWVTDDFCRSNKRTMKDSHFTTRFQNFVVRILTVLKFLVSEFCRFRNFLCQNFTGFDFLCLTIGKVTLRAHRCDL